MTEDNDNSTEEFVLLETEMKRGTGTRDQDKHKIVVKREDYDQAMADFNHAVAEFEDDFAPRVRDLQPSFGVQPKTKE